MTSDTEPGADGTDLEHERGAWTAAPDLCGDCIPWNEPIRRHVPLGAPALTYAGWLLWHLHVRLHQGLGGRT